MTTESKLQERIKELGCLYQVVQIASEPEATLDTVLGKIVKLLPPAWQYTEAAAACIVVDNCQYATRNHQDAIFSQLARLRTKGKDRGYIEVVYTTEQPSHDEGPFLIEERRLIDTLAGEISGIVERHDAHEERHRLEKQLRHADRLATIGQLAASIAHELNEPLSSILGFAQLAQKSDDLSSQTRQDLNKIVKASLYSREIVNKLRLFARQMPSHQDNVDINLSLGDSLSFIEKRCRDSSVRIVMSLAPDLPQLFLDPGQLHQMVVNLLVNATQAMPEGGVLTIKTSANESSLDLSIKDTGVGMPAGIVDKIFLPFFTTKDADHGTGLGLSIVDGIVAAQGATIDVKSTPGKGSTFTISFPLTLAESRAVSDSKQE